MAKINRVSCQIKHWRVQITVEDPDCSFSIKPFMTYMRVFNGLSENAAIRAAANYCNKYMNEYPGGSFSYSTKIVEPHRYSINYNFQKED